MQYVSRAPSAALAPFVRHLGYAEGIAGNGRERALPTGVPQLLVNLAEDRFRVYGEAGDAQAAEFVGGAALSGPQSRVRVIDTADQRETVWVAFRPGGAAPFFAGPADRTGERLLDLDALWGDHAGGELRERLAAAATPGAKLDVVEQVLLSRAVRPLRADPGLEFAVGELHRGRPVAQVAERCGLTGRAFTRRFADNVGLTPKRFARVRRFQRALAAIPHDRPVDWAEIAHRTGYFDQAHFVKEFRAFTGLAPSAYRPRSATTRNHVPLG
ncbi:helix-turn-helix domain-containing protein [Actinopolymorpha singaporensis]